MIQSNTNNATKQINEKVRNGVYIITHFKPLSQLFFHIVVICFLTQNTWLFSSCLKNFCMVSLFQIYRSYCLWWTFRLKSLYFAKMICHSPWLSPWTKYTVFFFFCVTLNVRHIAPSTVHTSPITIYLQTLIFNKNSLPYSFLSFG